MLTKNMKSARSLEAALQDVAADPEHRAPKYSTGQTRTKPGISYLVGWPRVLAQYFIEDAYNLLSSQGDDGLIRNARKYSFDTCNVSQCCQAASNSLQGKLEKTEEIIGLAKGHSLATLNCITFHSAVHHPLEACASCGTSDLQCPVVRSTPAASYLADFCLTCYAQRDNFQLSQSDTAAQLVNCPGGLNEEQNVTEATAQHSEETHHGAATSRYQRTNATYERSKHSSSRKTQRTRLLRAWFATHQEHPYPTPEDIFFLSSESGLTKTQVSNWFTNSRRLQRISRLRTSFFSVLSPVPKMVSGVGSSQRRPREQPSLDAVVSTPSPLASHGRGFDCSPLPHKLKDRDSNAGESHSAVPQHPRSTPSTPAIYKRHLSRDVSLLRPSHRDQVKKVEAEVAYHCTFCRIPFKKKHDWVRHERSVHMPCLDTYTCSMLDESGRRHPLQVWRATSVIPECALCGHPSPDEAHYKWHDFEMCSERPVGQRTFSRKDHFWQHLWKYHSCRKWEGWAMDLDVWRLRNNDIGARCGFCGVWIDTWDERIKHVEHHFKMGMQIDDWINDKGDGMPVTSTK